jgi:uncharacterized protein YjbI with pentapeptide repeats
MKHLTASDALRTGRRFAADGATPARDRTVTAAALRAQICAKDGFAELIGCTIAGPIDLNECSVGHLILRNCAIETLDARDARFAGSVDLDGSTVAQDLSLLGAIVEGVLSLRLVTVKRDLNLVNCRVRSGVPATKLSVARNATAYDLTVEASLDLGRAEFGGAAEFSNLHVGRTLKLEQAVFRGDATFDDATAVVVMARGAQFHARASFTGANVASKFSMEHAQFHGNASFAAAQVGSVFVLAQCRIGGELDLCDVKAHALTLSDRVHGATKLDGLAVTGIMDASGCTFNGAVSGVGMHLGVLNVRSSRFHQDLTLRDLTVEAGANFSLTRLDSSFHVGGGKIGGDLLCAGTAFHGVVGLETVNVTGSVRFERHAGEQEGHGEFRDRVSFSGVTIGSDLLVTMATGDDVTVDLTGSDVAGDVELRAFDPQQLDLSGASISGDLRLRALVTRTCKLANTSIDGDVTIGEHSACETIDLYGTSVGGTLSVCDSHVRGELKAKYVTVRRDADFRGSTVARLDVRGGTVEGSVNLRELHGEFPSFVGLCAGKLGAIEIMDAIDDADAETRHRLEHTWFDLSGCSYDHLACDPELLMDRFSDPRNFQPYLQLEAMLRKRGLDSRADRVYARGRRASKSPAWTGGRIRDELAEKVADYGTSFRRVGFFIVLTFVVGWLYFALMPGSTRLSAVTNPAAKAPVSGTLLDAAPGADPACAHPVPAGFVAGAWIAFQAVIPAAFPSSGWAIADDCPVLGGTWSIAITMFIVLVLKIVEWTLLPVLLLMISGVIRPRAST